MRRDPLSGINELKLMGLQAIRDLETPDGLLASGRNEAYGCIFGRDSLISALQLLRAYEREPNEYYLHIAEKVLRSLSNLQGRYINLESGEEPGKIVHEYRPERHEHLTQLAEDPWFLYPEGVMRNYDTVDATPLFLMTVAAYARLAHTEDQQRFVTSMLPSARAALRWVMKFESFLTYSFHPDRKHGGLKVQSWMDSTESVFYEDREKRPPYPMAPVEVQAYAWCALKSWADLLADDPSDEDRLFAKQLEARAGQLKRDFNRAYVLSSPGPLVLAFAIDGSGQALPSARSSMGHVLWASYAPQGMLPESILDSEFIPALRVRLLKPDLFVAQAGIRTLSSKSRHYDPVSYHNGSIWPHDTALLADGLENFGYIEDAARVRRALLRAYAHFNTPIELFAWDHGFKEYAHPNGSGACKVQAWSAAGLLSITAAIPAQGTELPS
jgi:glycogen debranching enzyme